MTCRKAQDFVARKPLGVSPGGAGPGADLGGSSNYSGEGFVPPTPSRTSSPCPWSCPTRARLKVED
jgi:hypothetical protein